MATIRSSTGDALGDARVLCYTVESDEAGQRIDKFLVERVVEITRAEVQRHIDAGFVLVDGARCRAKDRVRSGATVEMRLMPPQATRAVADPSVELNVVHEDDELLVVDKPARLVVHPARGHTSGTMVNGLLARPGFLRERVEGDGILEQLRPGIVHRIDKDTSGLLVVAKTAFSREDLKRQLAAHTVERSYVAVTIGVPRSRTIATMYGRDPRSRLRFSSEVRDGKRAVTHVKVVETLARGRAALIECRLETGRTHQIRVHLSEQERTPLLGDELYGGLRGPAEIVEIARKLGRQALHARSLGFVHPRTKLTMSFSSPTPADIQTAITSLRAMQT